MSFWRKLLRKSNENPLADDYLSQVEQVIALSYIDPYLGTDLISSNTIKRIFQIDNQLHISIVLNYPGLIVRPLIIDALSKALKTLNLFNDVCIDVQWDIPTHLGQRQEASRIKNIIAVSSGKGGVGKSTTSANLALALASEGASVGILDADIYGPSIPTMLGLSGYPASDDGKTMNPKVSFGVQTISIGYLIEEDQPMIWRGPMVTNALQQLLNDTKWDNIDYLIVDLPPGTGDIQLTLAQQIPVTGAVIVTTPQDIALIDAQRGLGMFEKVNVPVLGVVENMSMHICSNCGHEEAIFGQGGGAAMAKKNEIELLGSLPLDIHIREFADSGRPTVVADPDGRATEIYKSIARKMAAKLALKGKDYSSKFPNIVIQNT